MEKGYFPQALRGKFVLLESSLISMKGLFCSGDGEMKWSTNSYILRQSVLF